MRFLSAISKVTYMFVILTYLNSMVVDVVVNYNFLYILGIISLIVYYISEGIKDH